MPITLSQVNKKNPYLLTQGYLYILKHLDAVIRATGIVYI